MRFDATIIAKNWICMILSDTIQNVRMCRSALDVRVSHLPTFNTLHNKTNVAELKSNFNQLPADFNRLSSVPNEYFRGKKITFNVWSANWQYISIRVLIASERTLFVSFNEWEYNTKERNYVLRSFFNQMNLSILLYLLIFLPTGIHHAVVWWPCFRDFNWMKTFVSH